MLSLALAFKGFFWVFNYVEETCTHTLSGREMCSAMWTTDRVHLILWPWPQRLNRTPRLFLLVLHLPAKGRTWESTPRNRRQPATKYRAYSSITSGIQLSTPKPRFSFWKQHLAQTIPCKSLHNRPTTDLNRKSNFFHESSQTCSDSEF